ncbi:MAG: type II toxin-antitoxin system VapC family toxin [Magnetococcus sp. DMHC-1]|nr:type II toxin-antitoxin system VapC family toxin [Magnetococcales bacterium]
MKSKIYVETSIVSYLAARPSRDLIVAAHQQITATWWHEQSSHFDLYASELVIQEISAGNHDAVARRLVLLEGLPTLTINEDALTLAKHLVQYGAVPLIAGNDALHIAIATVQNMDFLLTWNCKHIANAVMRYKIEKTCRGLNFEPPTIATPEQFLEE